MNIRILLATVLLSGLSGAAPGGFLFVTFKGEQSPLTEQVYFALSADGRNWSALNRSRPVLVSDIGEKGVRDPWLLRSRDGKGFHLIATDLSIHRNPDWPRAARAGSRAIVVWDSADLVKWSKPRLVEVAAPDAGCTWAPEAVPNEEGGDYLVFWASTNRSDNHAKFRIWAARTTDFRTFGKPFIFIEKPNPVIDTTIVRDGDAYYRFTKDEQLKSIFLETARSLRGPWSEVGDFTLAGHSGYEGPQCYLIEPATAEKPALWGLILDHYARGRGYQAYSTRDLARGNFAEAEGFSFPFPFRHGSVLPVTGEEFSRLKAAYGDPDPEAPAADPLAWTNPLVPNRADPHVTFHCDGCYYLAATVPEYDRIELRRARSLDGLAAAEPKVIWRKHDTGPMGAHIWAPELHFIDGKWYLYFTAGNAEDIWAIRPYVLEGEGVNPLEARWTEKGRIKLGWESFSLDGTTFEHRGVRYFVWTQCGHPPHDGTNIYIAAMDSPTSITGQPVMLTHPEHDWETRGHRVNEAPSVIIRNGRVWMTYSASATDANYCLGLLSAPENSDLLDSKSWRKSPTPVFRSHPAASQFGPGHNCFTTTPDGKTDILVYHSRNYEKIHGDPLHNPDRATRAQVLRWRSDGSPDFSVPVPDGPWRKP